ncbi:DnaJ C-terminal domain-containing protein [Sedimentitalea sp. JM2-8]|uniref:DnaJ C-terminal domain-containing protein n=1 Tax=Sedimentitalea xiamensis TaxID=3050037 RepID=A0ABT7FJY3_9RHOB|nr:DnaJ C-terminal domain-containing protein [Sedimentitalea xiamensis]MDK3075089.1 DnaJ C-terminal domain-containing protein [Sedimentitalea xiamensis]
MSTDPYSALGVKKTATADEIKKAYRKIARANHPDLKPDDAAAEARFKAAAAAYDILKDPETRGRFDRGEIDASGAERQQQRQYYRDYADAPNNPYRSGPRPEDFADASDIFAEFMRARGRAGGGASGFRAEGFSARGQDAHYTLEVDFLQAVNGGKTRITLPNGQGLEVAIPRGTADGQTIRLRGKGGPGLGDGPPGDALVTLTVRPHRLFRRDGNDIVITLPITLDEAVLGGKVTTPTIDGTVSLTIPKGASSGQVLRLRGRGVQPATKGARGDQRVELSIVAPPRIDDKLADFMEGWRKDNAYDPRRGMNA